MGLKDPIENFSIFLIIKGFKNSFIKITNKNNFKSKVITNTKTFIQCYLRIINLINMEVNVQNTTVISADGSSKKLGEYSGEVMLIVNVASYCGNTAQSNR